MKMNHTEVSDPSVKLWNVLGQRPMETEADLIAAATKPGACHRQDMLMLIEDSHDDELGNWCTICSTDSDTVRIYWESVQGGWQFSMSAFGVPEWTPDIYF